MKFVMDKDSLEKIGSYLASRPWNEVHQLIGLLSQAQPLKESEPEQESPKKG